MCFCAFILLYLIGLCSYNYWPNHNLTSSIQFVIFHVEHGLSSDLKNSLSIIGRLTNFSWLYGDLERNVNTFLMCYRNQCDKDRISMEGHKTYKCIITTGTWSKEPDPVSLPGADHHTQLDLIRAWQWDVIRPFR